MSEPFIGEIRPFPYKNFVPIGWLLCDGNTYAVGQYQALFSILYNRFGGDGKTTFKVPNLVGMIPMHQGLASNNRGSTTFPFSKTTGANTVTVDWPAHTHQLLKHPPATGGAAQKVATPSATCELAQFSNSAASVNYNCMAANGQQNAILNPAVLDTWGSATPQGHENRQPFVCMYYAIAYDGIYPIKS